MVSGTKYTRDLGLGFQKKAKVLEDSHQQIVNNIVIDTGVRSHRGSSSRVKMIPHF